MSLGLNVQNFAVAFKVDPKVLEWLQKGGILGLRGDRQPGAKEELCSETLPGGCLAQEMRRSA